jgi:hypothetical protein
VTPPILYKYRALSEFTVPMLERERVWYAIPSTLNDPFDCKARLVGLGADTQRAVEFARQTRFATTLLMLKRATEGGRGGFGLSAYLTARYLERFTQARTWDERDALVDAVHHSASIQIGRSDPITQLRSIEEALDRVGVLSLSAVDDSMLMWTHYTGDHTGFCLGFENPGVGSRPRDAVLCAPIHYATQFPELDTDQVQITTTYRPTLGAPTPPDITVSIDDTNLRTVLYTKSAEWAYEQEWRCVRDPGGCEASYPGPLREVVFGARTSDSDRAVIRAAVEKGSGLCARFRRVVVEHGSFRLTIVDEPGPSVSGQ